MNFWYFFFTIYLISGFIVFNNIDFESDDLCFLSDEARFFLPYIAWIPVINSINAIGIIGVDIYYLIKKLVFDIKFKIWFLYAREISNRYWKIQTDLIKKNGIDWYLKDLDEEITGSLKK